jgi:CubicO group peptidase (beta-lactamase class C family)
VKQLAENAALVTYRATQNTTCGQTKVPSPSWVASTFVKRNGRWRNAIYQQTPVPNNGDLTAATDSLRKLVESGFMPSVAYSVSNRAGIIEEGAFGLADIAHRRKATAFTAYPVASVAKSLTALAALRAADAGRLDLDRPANSYLGRDSVLVPVGDPRRLTTRALLHMTGGIPHVVRFYWPDESRDAGLDRPLGHFAAFAPGTQFHYSNQSLGIVGEILARISGESFPRYMSESVFVPLGMNNTEVRAGDIPTANRALAYRDHPMRESGFTRLDPEPGAGMYTSAHDLGVLARRVLLDQNSRFLSAKSKTALTDFSQYPFYSSGWWKDPFRPSGLTLLADGAALGHAASLKVLPKEGLAVAVLVNGSAPDGFTLGLCDLLLRAAGYVNDAAPGNQEIPAEFRDVPVAEDTTWRGTWSGVIRTPTGDIPIRFSFDSTGMSASFDSGPFQPAKGTISNHILEANIAGELPRADVAGVAHKLGVRLQRQNDVLTGYLVATAQLGDRPFLMLPYYVSAVRDKQ